MKLIRLFMVVKIYIPRGYFPGQELAPSPNWRVASGLLSLISRRFFINQIRQLAEYDRGIATKYCCKYRAIGIDFPNLISFLGERRKVKGKRS
jgi:hypothetical protein